MNLVKLLKDKKMNIDKALSEYTNCLKYNKQWHVLAQNGDIDSFVNIGADFASCEMFDYAVTCWQYVIDSGKGNAEAYSNLGVSYYYGNGVIQDYKKAVQYYQKAAAKDHPIGMYNLAVACENGNGTPKDMKKAVKYYRMAAEKGVNTAIDALMRLGLYDELQGLALYPRNINDNTFSPSNNYLSCMGLAVSKGNLAIREHGTLIGKSLKDEAIGYYLKAISYNETYDAYYGLATLCKDWGEYQNAINFYEQAIKIDSNSYKSYNDMGYCYYELKDDIKALECFKKSFDINPNGMVLRNMGNCYKNLGEIEQFKDCYNKADMIENGLTS